MPTVLLAILVAVLLLAGVYFVGQLAWLLGHVGWAVWRQSRQCRATVRRDLAESSTEALRSRILTDVYFDDAIRADPRVGDFLARLAQGHEVALRREYSRRRLYGMLIEAERAAGRRGRPEVIETILFEQFNELARRAASKTPAV